MRWNLAFRTRNDWDIGTLDRNNFPPASPIPKETKFNFERAEKKEAFKCYCVEFEGRLRGLLFGGCVGSCWPQHSKKEGVGGAYLTVNEVHLSVTKDECGQ